MHGLCTCKYLYVYYYYYKFPFVYYVQFVHVCAYLFVCLIVGGCWSCMYTTWSCVCDCACMHVCMSAFQCVCVCTFMHIYIFFNVILLIYFISILLCNSYACTQYYACVHFIYVHVCMNDFMYTYMDTCIHMCLYVCLLVCINSCIFFLCGNCKLQFYGDAVYR